MTPLGARFDVQLKGSGPTPYSRGGDGRAWLGPMLREYIISEAMHALGVATTRSLAVVKTGEPVLRGAALPGAVLTRVSASHLRVGTFQFAAKWGTSGELRALADYALKRHFPDSADANNPYLSLLQEVIKLQASLIAKWQLVGFVHGVMNTDNMALSGETIDYGPCAFMDKYDPSTVFSSIDHNGRYAYGRQPDIAIWNLTRFAEALLSLLHKSRPEAIELAKEALADFAELYRGNWVTGMRAKLGLFNEEPEDEALISSLLAIMHEHGADLTNTFVALTFGELDDTVLSGVAEFERWHGLWQLRLSRQEETREECHSLMKASNPGVIPRNHRVEEALAAAVEQGDYSVMHRLLTVLADPYSHAAEHAEYRAPSNRPYRTYCGT
jgi:uncharacterized protein YdiU (UPF0061 family)